MAAASKICPKCGFRKVLSEFGHHWKTDDKRRNVCKRCEADAARARRATERQGKPDRRKGSLASGKDWLEQAQTELYPGRRCMELESREWLAVVDRARKLKAQEVAA